MYIEPGGNRVESCSNNGSGEPLLRRDPHLTARVAPFTLSTLVSDPKNAFDSREGWWPPVSPDCVRVT